MHPELDFGCGEYTSTFELSNFSLLRPYLSFVRVTWQHSMAVSLCLRTSRGQNDAAHWNLVPDIVQKLSGNEATRDRTKNISELRPVEVARAPFQPAGFKY